MLGDWSARVWSYQGDEQWSRVIGRHGLGKVSEAGLDLLSFCKMNNRTPKRTCINSRGSTQVPSWGTVLTVVMRVCQRDRCFDVQVMCCATCWSDHRMVRAKVSLCFDLKMAGKKKDTLKKHRTTAIGRSTAFDQILGEQLDQHWSSSTSVQEKWDTLVSCIQTTLQEVLPTQSKPTKDTILEEGKHFKTCFRKVQSTLDQVACITVIEQQK